MVNILTDTDAQTCIQQLRLANPGIKFFGGTVYGSDSGIYSRILVAMPSIQVQEPVTISMTGVTYNLANVSFFRKVLNIREATSLYSYLGFRFKPMAVTLV